jgi:hypothetical protein
VCSGNWLRVLERTWAGAETANASSRNIPPAGKDGPPRRTARGDRLDSARAPLRYPACPGLPCSGPRSATSPATCCMISLPPS